MDLPERDLVAVCPRNRQKIQRPELPEERTPARRLRDGALHRAAGLHEELDQRGPLFRHESLKLPFQLS